MTHIAVIGGSNRAEAQSHRVAEIVVEKLDATGATTDLVSMRDIALPIWDEGMWEKDKPADSPWVTIWGPVSERLKRADAAVIVAPEWNGMVSPPLKNLLHCCCNDGELAFKPTYLIAVSAGAGGAYPVAELRATGGKNSFIHWLPDHLIIRQVAGFLPGSPDNKSPEWLEKRMDHGLKMLLAYAEAVKPIRETVIDYSLVKSGM